MTIGLAIFERLCSIHPTSILELAHNWKDPFVLQLYVHNRIALFRVMSEGQSKATESQDSLG